MANLGFQFGSYVFSGTNALISNFNIKAGQRIRQQVIPRKDGAHIEEAFINPLIVNLKGTLSASSAEGLRTKKDDFLNAIAAGTQQLFIFDDRYIMAQKRSMTIDLIDGMKFLKFNTSFIAQVPFWVAVAISTDAQGITTATLDYDIGFDGSAYFKPLITIDAAEALSDISIENVTTGETISYSGVIGSTGQLIIDLDKFTVEKDGADDIANISGDFFSLVNGTNNLIYTGGNCTLTLQWNNRWY